MNKCPYLDNECEYAPDKDNTNGCEWAATDAFEDHDYGICRITGEYIAGGGENEWEDVSS